MTFQLPLKVHVTPEIAWRVIDNPYVTLADLDALIIWIGNEDTMGIEHPLYMRAMELQSKMIMDEYLKDNPRLTD